METSDDELTRAQLWALELFQRRLARLVRRLGELPGEETGLRRRLQETVGRLNTLEEELKAKQLSAKRLELEIDELGQRRSRHQRQLLEAKDNREYQTLLEEIENEKRRQTELEDSLLELMARLEELLPEVKGARSGKDAEAKIFEEKLAALSAERENLEGLCARLKQERRALVERLSPIGRRIYDKLAGQPHICALVNTGICSSCRMEIPTQTQSEVRAGELKNCESCSTVLFTEEQAALARTMARNRGFLPDGADD